MYSDQKARVMVACEEAFRKFPKIQLPIATEELCELSVQLSRYMRRNNCEISSRDNGIEDVFDILGEVADVEIIAEQIKYIFITNDDLIRGYNMLMDAKISSFEERLRMGK